MKTFLAVYTGTANTPERARWDAMPEAQRKQREQQGIQAWTEWMQKHQAAVVVQGAPLGKTKQVNRSGISDTRNNLAGYIVIQAESHEAAARMFENHPHFSIFPGEAVEIMECLPLPGQ